MEAASSVVWEMPTNLGSTRRTTDTITDDELRNPETGLPGCRLDLSMLPLRVEMLPGLLANNFTFSTVTVLNLNDCGLRSVPQAICSMVNLIRLRLHSNSLETLPRTVGDLCHLERLSVYGNRLTFLPRSFHKLTCLKILRLGGNMLRDESLDVIQRLSGLEELYLRQNHELTAIPWAVCMMESLEVIDADCCDELEYPPLEVVRSGIKRLRLYAAVHDW